MPAVFAAFREKNRQSFGTARHRQLGKGFVTGDRQLARAASRRGLTIHDFSN